MRTATLAAAAALGLAIAGFVTGVATVVLHSRWWGLVLGAVVIAVVLRALPRRWWTRLPFVAGWEVPVLVLGLSRGPGGDLVVAADLRGYSLLGLALLVAVAAVLTLPAGGRRRDESRSASTSA